MKKRIVFLILLSTLLLLSYNIVQAQGILPEAHGDECIINGVPVADKSECGNYSLDDIMRLAVNASGLILGLVGSLALVMFIYGGILMMTSGGTTTSSDGKSKINQGKKVIMAAIIGLIIVFCSYLIINFVLGSLGIEWKGEIEKMTYNSSQEIKV